MAFHHVRQVGGKQCVYILQLPLLWVDHQLTPGIVHIHRRIPDMISRTNGPAVHFRIDIALQIFPGELRDKFRPGGHLLGFDPGKDRPSIKIEGDGR